MKCIVTGGAGFVGSHLCDELLALDHSVVAVDNFITGNKKNIQHLLPNESFSFVEHDCSYPLPENLEADIIFHFASPASPPKYQKYPVETLLINSQGTYHLLEHARRHNARFVFASTSEIYGDPLEHPQKESYWGNVSSTGPRSCYDESKRVGEAYVMTYHRTFNVDTRIVRIFNTYGPRMDINDGRVVTNFIKQVLEGALLSVYGKGDQTRSFCYVSDLVSGILSFALKENLSGEIVNVGNPNEMTIEELTQELGNVIGKELSVRYFPLPQDDPKRRKPDITKITQLTGWQPHVPLSNGLKKTYDYFSNKR